MDCWINFPCDHQYAVSSSEEYESGVGIWKLMILSQQSDITACYIYFTVPITGIFHYV